MSLNVIELVAIGLFVAEVLEVLKHGNIFEDYRARLEAGFFGHPDRFHVQLLRCMFCLSVWVTGVVVLFMLTRPYLHPLISFVGSFFVLTGALTRLSNVFHDLVRPFSRTPNSTAVQEYQDKLNRSHREQGATSTSEDTEHFGSFSSED